MVNKKTSAGHEFADASRLDKHYLAAQAEYEDTLNSAGIQPGWKVLDAGCGNGVFLPLLSTIVGSGGSIAALDVAEENVNAVQHQISQHRYACHVEAQTGTISNLPYESNSFDAVWCANVTMYLTEAELETAISEFARVLRPGGIVAIKEVDLSVFQFQPLSPELVSRWLTAAQQAGITHIQGASRGTRMPSWIRVAGFEITKRQTFLVERWAPLGDVERDLVAENLGALANKAPDLGLSNEDQQQWAEVRDSPDRYLDDPDFCYRAIHVLTVGVNSSENNRR
ncbi:MAG: methyltransferase domain-containing protein [Chloroflexota bacterium]